MLTRFYQGFGIAFFFLPLLQLSLNDIPKDRLPSATGLFHFVRILIGSGFGTSLSIYLWSRLEIFHHARLSELDTIHRLVTTQFYEYMNNFSTIFDAAIVNRVLDEQIEQQAYMLSTNNLSWLSAWLFLGLIPLVFLCHSVKAKKGTVASE